MKDKKNKIWVVRLNDIIFVLLVLLAIYIGSKGIWSSYFDKSKTEDVSVINSTSTNVNNKKSEVKSLSYDLASGTISNLKIEVANNSGWMSVLNVAGGVLPIIFFLFLILSMRGMKAGGIQALGFGNSRAKRIDPDDEKQRVMFKDVAGNKNAKQDLLEIVEFLKSPEKFLAIGASIPKGVLLTGRPGTGKTMLAKAVAGEAKVPFFYLSGSEFIEMYVGVGASRVRDLFLEAKKVSPSIIFIDEIDSIGRSRGVGTGGGSDEREQTLNQILVEMDGFDAREKVIVIAATNRADVLDTALLRPGRFDRRVYIDLPDRKEREDILKSHIKEKPLADDVNLSAVAMRTPGFSGADLQSLMNEAAIKAARDNRKSLMQSDILDSIEKVLLGPERQSHLMNEEEKKIVAYHEAGHALVASLMPHADPVQKVSIISRGNAGGYTLKLPDRERKLHTKSHMVADMAMTYGGYAAELIVYGEVTTGPSSDIQAASSMARDMVRLYGMSDTLGAIAYETHHRDSGIVPEGNIYSQHTGETIDREVQKLLDAAKATAIELLKQHRSVLDAIAEELIKVENLERAEYESLLSAHNIKLKR